MIKGSVPQRDITILNIYVPNIRAHKYIQQIPTDLKRKRDNTIVVGVLLLSTMDRLFKQEIKRTHWT